jgi:predicted permease
MLTTLLHRLRALFRRDTVERELDDELQFHVDQQIERYERAGLSPDLARRRATLDVGSLDAWKDACRDERGVAPLERLLQDAGYAVRVLRQRPAFTATLVGTLALGIGATTAAFGILDGIVLRPLPYRDAARLVQIGTTFGTVQVAAVSAPDFVDLAARTATLSAIGVSRAQPLDLTGDGAPERVSAAAASASFFEVLGVPPLHGRVFGRDSDAHGAAPAAVLSYAFWQRRFARDPAAIGRSLMLDGVPHTIVAIMPGGFRGPDALGQQDTAVWVPFGTHRRAAEDRDDASWSAIARLAPDGTIESVTLTSSAAGRRFWLSPLADRTIGDTRRQLWLLFASVSALMLIGTANIAGLQLVRAIERRREMAIRTALGAGRGRLVRQLLTEGAIVTLAGGALGVALAGMALGAFRAFGPADLPRIADVTLDGRVLAFTIALTTLAGLLFGLMPAIGAARARPTLDLHSTAPTLSAARTHVRARGALVVLQVALALTLVTGAGLVGTSLIQLGRVAPGFDARGVVWMDVTLPARYADAAARLGFFDTLLTRLRATSGVDAAGAIAGRPLGGGNAVATMHPEGALPPDGQQVARVPYHAVSPGYFAAMRIPILNGRDVRDDDVAASPRVAIVSRSFAEQFWPGERAIGKRFWMGRVAADAPLTTVVGVVEDVRQYGLERPREPIVYRAATQLPRSALTIVARWRGGDETAGRDAIDRMRATAWSLDPSLPLDRAGTMTAAVRESIGEPRFRTLALALFGAIATLLASVGLYATVAWMVRARRHELAIRVVLGADARGIRRLVIGHGMRLAMAGVGFGTAAAIAAAKLVESIVFGISATEPAVLAGAAVALLAVAFLACWIPARRVSDRDAVTVLRA